MQGRLKPKPEMYTGGGSLNTRWAMDDVLKEYDSFLSKQIAESNAWRMVGMIAVFMLVIMCFCFIYIGFKPKKDYLVIGVNDIGQVKYYGSTSGKSFDSFTDTEKVKKNIINEFVTKRFTMTTDSDVLYSNFQSCLYFLNENRRKAFIDEVNAEDPFSNVGKLKGNVQMDTIIPVTQNSYQAEWYTTYSELTGSRMVKKHYRGIFSFARINVEQYSKLAEVEYLNNPSSYYITDYNIEEIKVEQ